MGPSSFDILDLTVCENASKRAGCRARRATEQAIGQLVVWGRPDIIRTVVDRWDGEGTIEVLESEI